VSSKTWSVWVGGSEVNSYYLTFTEALSIAEEWKAKGYDDVVMENYAD
jgi:hypothetical protein